MASTISPPPKPEKSPSGGSVQFETSESGLYIDQQLRQTRRRVKMIDLFTALAVLGTGFLIALLALVIVDHWLVGFSVLGRWLILLVLLSSVSAFVVYCISNLLFRRINPKFAALMIEESAPSLKNSLINLLSFRFQPEGIRKVVYREMESQAAADLTHVPIDTTVDRSRLIHISYFFLGVFIFAAAYIILSPKDPFQTLARIAAPWADIARPSRVQISNVQPGDQEFYYGQQATITVEVVGLGSNDLVTLFFTTGDRQLVDQAVPMRWDEAKQHYICLLPDADNASGLAGLEQDLAYYITAGDAQSLEYQLRVLPAPTIFVERIELQYPKYTSRSHQTLDRQGDLQALEGTRVTIHARANQPIRSATIEFDPEQHDLNQGDRAAILSRGQNRIALKVEGNNAVGSFVLKLKSDRKTPEHTSYRIRFSNEKGMQNEQPFVHQIEVLRDLSPEVQILEPQKEVVEVPEDGSLTIKARAIDPDYGLSRVALIVERGPDELLDETLLEDARGFTGQAVLTYSFVPRDLQLKAGDEVVYWVAAEDNRTAYESDRLQANLSQSRERRIKIVAGQGDSKAPKNNDSKANDKENPGDPEKKQDPKQNNGENGKTENQDKGNQDQKQAPGEKGSDQKQQPNNKTPQDRKSQNDQQQEKQKGDMPPKDKQQQQPENKEDGNKQPGDKQQDQNQQGDKQQDQKQSDQKQQNKNQQQQGGKGSQGQGGGQKSEQKQEGSQGGKGQQKSDQQGDNQGNSKSSNAQGGNSQNSQGSQNNQNQANADQKSGSGDQQGEQRTEKAHDGEVFEKVLERLKKQGETPQDEPQDDLSQEKGQQKPQDPNQSGPPKKQSQKGSQKDASDNSKQEPKPQGGQGQQAKDSQGSQKMSQKNGTSPRKANGQKTSDASKKGTPDEEQKPAEGKKKDPMKEESDGGQEGNEKTPANKKNQGTQDQSSNGNDDQKKGSSDVSQNDFRNKVKPKDNSKPSAAKKSAAKEQDKQSGKPRNEKNDDPQGYNEKDKKSRNTKSGDSGDKTGQGKQGAGQNAKREGNGVAGGGKSSDQGASGAKDKGAGDTSKSAGNKERAEGKTGAKGEEKGEGSTSKANPQGKQKGDGAPQGKLENDDAPLGKPPKAKNGKPQEKGKSRAPGSSPLGGGGIPDPNQPQTRAASPEGVVPPGEKANLDYARKATDLVLKRLGEQEDDPDQDLLDDLGYSKEDLKKFLARWRKIKQSATEDDGSNRKLDNKLRSLGLRSDRDALLKGEQNAEQRGALSNSGNSSKPPLSFLEKFNAYKKGAARAASGR